MAKSTINNEEIDINQANEDRINLLKGMPEWINSLTGIIKVDNPNDFDCDQAKYEYFKEKYNL